RGDEAGREVGQGHVVGAGGQVGELVEAAAGGRGLGDLGVGAVEEGDGDAVDPGLAGVADAVVVDVVPDLVAQGEAPGGVVAGVGDRAERDVGAGGVGHGGRGAGVGVLAGHGGAGGGARGGGAGGQRADGAVDRDRRIRVGHHEGVDGDVAGVGDDV